MATYYVTSTATGTGDGSVGNPWTLAQFATNHAGGDIALLAADGDYFVSNTITLRSGNFFGRTKIAAFSGRPKIKPGVGFTGTMFECGSHGELAGIELDGLNQSSRGVNASSGVVRVRDCWFRSFTGEPFVVNNAGCNAIDCWWSQCGSPGNSISFAGCVAAYNHGDGIRLRSWDSASMIDCVAIHNGGIGVIARDSAKQLKNVVVANNDSHGIDVRGSAKEGTYIQNCVIANNNGNALLTDNISANLLAKNIGHFGNAALAGHTIEQIGVVEFSADPFVSAEGGNFNLTDQARNEIAAWDIAFPNLPNTQLKSRLAIAQNLPTTGFTGFGSDRRFGT